MNRTVLNWERIAAETGMKVVWRAETGSTNDDARELAAGGAAHGTVVLADWQHRGRGRRGAPWISPPQQGLLCSVILRPDCPTAKWSRLTHACALAMCEALERVPDLPRPAIKWPNDIFLNGRKVSGILVESVMDARGGFAVAGAGVNLNLTETEIPGELRDVATSVRMELGGRPVSREDFAVLLLGRLQIQCARALTDFPALLTECESRSFLRGKRVRCLSGERELEGLAAGAGPEGELRLVLDGGTVELVSSADFVRPVCDDDGPERSQ